MLANLAGTHLPALPPSFLSSLPLSLLEYAIFSNISHIKKLYNEISHPLSRLSCFAPLCLPQHSTYHRYLYLLLCILLEFCLSRYYNIGVNILIFPPPFFFFFSYKKSHIYEYYSLLFLNFFTHQLSWTSLSRNFLIVLCSCIVFHCMGESQCFCTHYMKHLILLFAPFYR